MRQEQQVHRVRLELKVTKAIRVLQERLELKAILEQRALQVRLELKVTKAILEQ